MILEILYYSEWNQSTVSQQYLCVVAQTGGKFAKKIIVYLYRNEYKIKIILTVYASIFILVFTIR